MLGVAGGSVALLNLTSRPAKAADDSGYDLTYTNDELAAYFQDIQADENAHVAFLTRQLGGNARPTPTFQNLEQADLATFIQTSQLLENTGVGAYLGSAKYIFKDKNVSSAGAIALIEARHAGFLNGARNYPITGYAENLSSNESFETPLTIDQVVANASPLIADLNGGPALTFGTTRSPLNDTRILNFALALEQLEAAFYNTNVPKFFPT